jgi:glutathione S-transferase
MAPTKGEKAPVVDYSVLEVGTRLQAESYGVYYAAEVVTVSTSKNRAKAPVKVHFPGYDASEDIWVGAASIRSKLLKAAMGKDDAKPAKGKDAKKGEKKDKPKLEVEMGYWAIRGLGAPLRMILEYKGVKYTDNQYSDGDKWFKEDKPKLLEKNPLTNLPYVKAGDTVVTQSNACLSYLGMRLGMSGRDPVTKFNNEQLLCEIMDTRNAMIELVYPFKKVNRDEAEFNESAKKSAEGPFDKYEAWLANSKTDYFCGPKPLTADFHIWEMLDQHKMVAAKIGAPDFFTKFPLCKAFYDRFRAIESLQKYFESDSYKLPCNNKMANCYFA